jgi:hypothetical protein
MNIKATASGSFALLCLDYTSEIYPSKSFELVDDFALFFSSSKGEF